MSIFNKSLLFLLCIIHTFTPYTPDEKRKKNPLKNLLFMAYFSISGKLTDNRYTLSSEINSEVLLHKIQVLECHLIKSIKFAS